MLLHNRPLFICILLIVLHQALLGLSTYQIALAGSQLTHDSTQGVLSHIMLFFVYALLAYLAHSVSQYFSTQAKQRLFAQYLDGFFEKITQNQAFNSNHNKLKSIAWLTGEAKQGLFDISDFIIKTCSTYLNIIITFGVFYLTIGFELSMIIFVSFLVSIVITAIAKRRIKHIATTIQQDNLAVNETLPIYWDYHLFGSSTSLSTWLNRLHQKLANYFGSQTSYVKIEQVVSATPIVLCTLGLVLYLYQAVNIGMEDLAVMVAVLPRTLQLLGSVHTVAINNSQYNYHKAQYRSIIEFLPTAVAWEDNIKPADIDIKSQGVSLDFDELYLHCNHPISPKRESPSQAPMVAANRLC